MAWDETPKGPDSAASDGTPVASTSLASKACTVVPCMFKPTTEVTTTTLKILSNIFSVLLYIKENLNIQPSFCVDITKIILQVGLAGG